MHTDNDEIDGMGPSVLTDRLVGNAMKDIDRGLTGLPPTRFGGGYICVRVCACGVSPCGAILTRLVVVCRVSMHDHARVETVYHIDAMDRCRRCIGCPIPDLNREAVYYIVHMFDCVHEEFARQTSSNSSSTTC